MGDWREDRNLLPKLGWILEYLLEEGQGSVSILSDGSGLDESKTELLIELMSLSDWFVTDQSSEGELCIWLSEDDSMRKAQETYLTGILNRVSRAEKLFREQEVEGRVWLQLYASQDVLIDRKSSGTYYRVRLPDRMLAIAGIEKGDQVHVDAVPDELESSTPTYLKITEAPNVPGRRGVYEIFDEAPSNYDPKLTIPAEHREGFVKSDEDKFKIEVWEPASGDTHLRIYQQDTITDPDQRQSLLYENQYWAINTAEPLPTIFYPENRRIAVNPLG